MYVCIIKSPVFIMLVIIKGKINLINFCREREKEQV